jgi:hypothetical protein
LGPGTYDIDHTVHKEVMAVLFPKKKVPFNIKENRDVVEAYIPPKHETPGKPTVQLIVLGPGAYYPGRSDFARMMAANGVGPDGTFLFNDNGHINQRSQSYVSLNK